MSCNQAHPSQFEMLRRILGLVCSVCGIEMSIMQRLGACDLSLGLRVGIDSFRALGDCQTLWKAEALRGADSGLRLIHPKSRV